MTEPTPNAFAVTHGNQSDTNFFVEGPFATSVLAQAHADEHNAHSRVLATVVTLVNPANCEGR